MVKGISKQVIVVHNPEEKLFDQAIFILRDDAVGADGITDEMLLKEARRIISDPAGKKKRHFSAYGPVWACGGAMLTGLAWLISSFF